MNKMPEPNLESYLPHIKQQMLRELLTNKTYGIKEWEQLQQLLKIDGHCTRVRLILIYPENTESEHIFALANIAGEMLEQEGLLALSTTVGDTLVILVDHCSTECVRRAIEFIRHYYKKYYRLNFRSVLTDTEDISSIKKLYRDARSRLLGYSAPEATETMKLVPGYRPHSRTTPSDIVKNIIRYVDEHLSDPSLSLLKLSREVFYMNSDYLGKLFRKQTGERFSHYVMRKRMTKAAQYIASNREIKILDVAAMVGFKHNVQYFSQVFKKTSGYSPSEYRNRMTNERAQ